MHVKGQEVNCGSTIVHDDHHNLTIKGIHVYSFKTSFLQPDMLQEITELQNIKMLFDRDKEMAR